MPTVSIIIATSGRPTLRRAVESILPQLREGDEILCVGDNFCPDEPGCFNTADRSPLPSQFGNRQRNTGMALATGNVLCFLDDDDWHLPGSLDTIRTTDTVPRMFRAILPHGKTVWKDKAVRHANVGTCTIALPNRPELIPPWPVTPYDNGDCPRGTDFLFIRECCRRFNGVEWDPTVVYHCEPRPK